MTPIVSAEEMRWCDAAAIRTYGIPSLLLMENAGSAVARHIVETHGPVEGKLVVVIAGKGNNGGDGFVVARHLLQHGARVEVRLLGSPGELKGDPKTNWGILQHWENRSSGTLRLRYGKRFVPRTLQPNLVVDALFGTGFSGAVREPYRTAIEWINSRSVPVIAVDVPSGVDATSGVVENVAVKATATVTFGLPKTGLYCNQARDLVGKLVVADIGIPQPVLLDRRHQTFLVEGNDVRQVLPRRPSTSHKYSVGKVFVLAGSKGYTGAAALAATAALRAGAGAVLLGTPDVVYPVLARKLTESIVIPLPSTEGGSLSLGGFEAISQRIDWADVIAVGPGLSQDPETSELVRRVITRAPTKIILDADGLNALGPKFFRRLKDVPGEFILTPHAGELSRLIGVPVREIERDRIEITRKVATDSNVTLLLKGAPTVTSGSDGKVFVNSTGNPGMATVGSGDVLTGLVAALWSGGVGRSAAAYAAAYLHGKAGDCAKEKFGERSLVAGDLIDFLPEAFRRVELGDVGR